jgi:VCBS repeat-containing protein
MAMPSLSRSWAAPDAARFAIDAATGALSFVSAPDFEAPGDADGDNLYEVVVGASDGSLSDTQALAITVGNVNEAVYLTSGPGFSVVENDLAVATLLASDLDGTLPTFAIAGGADAALFTLDAVSGALSFVAAPDYEAPADADGDNVYDLVVTASDGSLSDTQPLAITITDANERAVITSAATAAVLENTTTVATVTAEDPDGDTVTFAIAGGADAARFAIDTASGALRFLVAPDFEAPADAGANNVYDVVVRASDGNLVATQALSVTVGDANDAPFITSNGGTWGAALVAEGSTAVTTVVASDPDAGETLVYSIGFSLDWMLFTIDSASGALSFVAAPDFEAPEDAGGDNVYDVVVFAIDGAGLYDSQYLSVHLTNVNEAPVITGPTSIALDENAIAVGQVWAIDPDSEVTMAIIGGADAALFEIDPWSGEIIFVTAPDFEAPTDADADNHYELVIGASDGSLADTQALSVTVNNVNEAPSFVSPSAWSSDENVQIVGAIAAHDPENGDIRYFVAGGADGHLFAADRYTGVLSFLQAPNFELPADADGDNVYEIEVGVVDGGDVGANVATTAIRVTVGDVDENLAFNQTAFAALENNTAVATLGVTHGGGPVYASYAITGGADAALFALAPGGALSFVAGRDFEAPSDAGGNNVYEVQVTATDGPNHGTATILVTLGNTNEAPVIAASTDFAANENGTAIGTIAASDPEGGALTYRILTGGDSARLAIGSTSGALTFRAAPNFESPTDLNHDNVYTATVEVSDGTFARTQVVSVAVGNVNEAPAITSGGGGTTASYSLAENISSVATIAATDPEGGVTFALAGGADAALFTINAGTGALSFLAAPDYDAPGDANGDNLYQVIVSASDGSLTDIQTLAVSVTNVTGSTINGTSKADTLTRRRGRRHAPRAVRKRHAVGSRRRGLARRGRRAGPAHRRCRSRQPDRRAQGRRFRVHRAQRQHAGRERPDRRFQPFAGRPDRPLCARCQHARCGEPGVQLHRQRGVLGQRRPIALLPAGQRHLRAG